MVSITNLSQLNPSTNLNNQLADILYCITVTGINVRRIQFFAQVGFHRPLGGLGAVAPHRHLRVRVGRAGRAVHLQAEGELPEVPLLLHRIRVQCESEFAKKFGFDSRNSIIGTIHKGRPHQGGGLAQKQT